MDNFVPNWKTLGWGSQASAYKHIADYLFAHKNNIIKLGFSEEVIFNVGGNQIILKGKNVGRKKDKRVE